VVLHRFVECGTNHLPLNRALHIGDLLRALADEADHEMDIAVVGGGAISDVLEDDGLARLGRGDDKPALPATDGSDQVQQAGGEIGGGGFQVDEPVGEDGGQRIEMGATLCLLRVDAVDRLDAQKAIVFLPVLWQPHLTGDHVASPEAEAANLGLRDVNIASPRPEVVMAQETIPLIHDL